MSEIDYTKGQIYRDGVYYAETDEGYIKPTEMVDDLKSDDSKKALSANMGKLLDEKKISEEDFNAFVKTAWDNERMLRRGALGTNKFSIPCIYHAVQSRIDHKSTLLYIHYCSVGDQYFKIMNWIGYDITPYLVMEQIWRNGHRSASTLYPCYGSKLTVTLGGVKQAAPSPGVYVPDAWGNGKIKCVAYPNDLTYNYTDIVIHKTVGTDANALCLGSVEM